MSESYLKIFKNCSIISDYLKILLMNLKNDSFNIRTVLNSSKVSYNCLVVFFKEYM